MVEKEPKKKHGFFYSLIRILKAKPEIPESLRENTMLRTILARRSTRRFKPDRIPEDVLKAVLEAGRMAPSTVNLQTWTFICFTPQTWLDVFGRKIPFQAPAAIMVLGDLHRLNLLREEFEFPNEPLTLFTAAVLNAGLAAMNMTLAAEACGLGSVMLSETGQTGLLDAGTLAKTLALPDDVIPLTTIVLGYPRGKVRGIPPRLPANQICGSEEYPDVDQEALSIWLEDMKAGYRASRIWKSLDGQVRVYREKIHQAEEDLTRMVYGRKSEEQERD